jgi:ribosomal protein S18 acetylase RimI-like enzyme
VADKSALRLASDEDLDRIAEIHVAAFPDSAISLLGTDVARAYYDWQLHGHENPYIVVAEADGRVIGFVVGGISRGALSGFMRHHLGVVIRAGLRRPHLLIVDPRVRRRVRTGAKALRTSVRRSSRGGTGAAVAHGEPDGGRGDAGRRPSFGILSIAVDPAARGTGTATMLIDSAEREARARGSASMHLSVHPGNTRAVRFYEREGWVRVPDEGWTGFMHKSLDPSTNS